MIEFVDFSPGCRADELQVKSAEMGPLAPGCVRLSVRAFGINRADTLQRQGKYPPPAGESPVLGLEVAGEVVACGEGSTRWQPGDKVFGLVAGGGYSSTVDVNELHLMPIPHNLSWHQAAGLAEVFLTAYQGLFDLGNLQCDQRVLIHAGASGVGLAAIQMAAASGAKVAVTASSEQKLALCQSMGADLLINYAEQEFAEQVKQSWGGVDLVVDFVGGEYLNRNLSCLNMDGTIVYFAMLGGRYSQLDMARLLAKRARIQGSTLRNRSDEYKADLVDAFRRRWLAAFESGQLVVNLQQVFAANEVGRAHELLEKNLSMGKFVGSWC